MTKGRKEQGQIRAARGLSRRRFLVGMGGLTLGLPYLEALAAPCLPGGACEPPQRFVLFHHQQGTVLDHWYPSGTETNFTLPTILSPVTPHQEQCLFIGGLDNVAAQLMSAGNGHSTANCSLYTGGGFADEAVGGNL